MDSKKKVDKNDLKKKIIIAVAIVACVVLLTSVGLIYSRGIVYFPASNNDGSIGATALASTFFANKVVPLRSNFLGVSLNQINPDAFRGANIKHIIIPDSVIRIGFNAFYDCKTLEDIVIPANTIIQHDAFNGCTSLVSVTIEEGATSIATNAFAGCTALENISIPNGLKGVFRSSFDGCESLVYSKYDNGLYLGNSENPYVVLIKANSDDIESCNIHHDTKVIAADAFNGYNKLVEIRYDGLAEDWNKIVLGTNWSKDTGKFKIYCLDETLSK